MNIPRLNTMKWLVKREFWEHKGGFFWAPVWVGGIMVAFLAATLFIGVVLGHSHGIEINGEHVNSLSQAMTPTERTDFVHGLASGYLAIAAPLYLVLAVTVFFFCLGALYDDRKDRSVLFWKSLPIADHATVLSKVAMAMAVAPLLTIALGSAVSLLSLLVMGTAGAMLGVNLFGVLLDVNLYLSPLALVGIVPVYALWALPTIGWLMMVSAWARTKPFLWAVGAPVMAGALLSWSKAIFGFDWNIGWFWQNIVGRGLLSVVPGSWFVPHPQGNGPGETIIRAANGMEIHRHTDGMGTLMMESWNLFATADLWIGAAIGAAMIFAAIRMRRWRDEG